MDASGAAPRRRVINSPEASIFLATVVWPSDFHLRQPKSSIKDSDTYDSAAEKNLTSDVPENTCLCKRDGCGV
jgi:hypothetical protein